MQGEPIDLHGRYLVADNGLIHGEILSLFRDIFEGRFQHEMPALPAAEWEVRVG
jgi:hypothetical protein